MKRLETAVRSFMTFGALALLAIAASTAGAQCVPPGSPCEGDNNPCTLEQCDGSANCVFVSNAADSTPCPDNDSNACTTAGCNGAGTCDQSHQTTSCPVSECAVGQCNPLTGSCIFSQDSTPCTDNDGNACTTAGCNGQGVCDQAHIPDTCTECEQCVAGQCVPQAPLPEACEPLNHFLCHEIHQNVLKVDRTLQDQFFGTSTVTVIKPKRLCAPADKNGEDPSAPQDTNHLTGYTIKQRTPRFVKIRGQMIFDQFHPTGASVDLIRADFMLAPTAKDAQNPPGPLPAPTINHFKCYRVRGPKSLNQTVNTVTQWGPRSVLVKRIYRLCAPANKNNEDPTAASASEHLACYKIKDGGPATVGPTTFFVEDQFGARTFGIFGARELCVPATKNVPPTTTSTSTSTSSTSTSTSTTLGQQCGNGVVEGSEQCDPPTTPLGSLQCPGSPMGAFVCKTDCTCCQQPFPACSPSGAFLDE